MPLLEFDKVTSRAHNSSYRQNTIIFPGDSVTDGNAHGSACNISSQFRIKLTYRKDLFYILSSFQTHEPGYCIPRTIISDWYWNKIAMWIISEKKVSASGDSQQTNIEKKLRRFDWNVHNFTCCYGWNVEGIWTDSSEKRRKDKVNKRQHYVQLLLRPRSLIF